ncbi:GNAT family N-acetyltransferase [Streptomyces sp. NBC_01775]|uniref:GNAT family N-acetyltransferase n=1 Tax=Streptomyces sp. NBC_01775 TaxID=2975939 RepID=UPI002DD801B8|nr:GNAT family N-acetyltransferase [Streptomyces sp. NBC_01775]WSB76228.1 GNAT family N-acetyltransferase [Streptomyces sp. NBC_01775]
MNDTTVEEAVTIRRAVAGDAGRLTELVQESGAYRGRYASIISGYAVTPDYLARHEVHVAVGPDGGTLGFYALVLDPPELDLAFVDDAAQGLGVGRQLIAHMKETAAKAGLREVRVVAHPPAEPFYLRTGARRTGTVPPMPPKVPWARPELCFEVTPRVPAA